MDARGSSGQPAGQEHGVLDAVSGWGDGGSGGYAAEGSVAVGAGRGGDAETADETAGNTGGGAAESDGEPDGVVSRRVQGGEFKFLGIEFCNLE